MVSAGGRPHSVGGEGEEEDSSVESDDDQEGNCVAGHVR